MDSPVYDILTLEGLPEEKILDVLSHLDPKSLVQVCATSKKIKRICRDVWKDLFKRDITAKKFCDGLGIDYEKAYQLVMKDDVCLYEVRVDRDRRDRLLDETDNYVIGLDYGSIREIIELSDPYDLSDEEMDEEYIKHEKEYRSYSAGKFLKKIKSELSSINWNSEYKDFKVNEDRIRIYKYGPILRDIFPKIQDIVQNPLGKTKVFRISIRMIDINYRNMGDYEDVVLDGGLVRGFARLMKQLGLPAKDIEDILKRRSDLSSDKDLDFDVQTLERWRSRETKIDEKRDPDAGVFDLVFYKTMSAISNSRILQSKEFEAVMKKICKNWTSRTSKVKKN